MSSTSREEFAAVLAPGACPIPVLAGQCGTPMPTGASQSCQHGPGEQGAPPGVAGAVEVSGSDSEEGAECPLGRGMGWSD